MLDKVSYFLNYIFIQIKLLGDESLFNKIVFTILIFSFFMFLRKLFTKIVLKHFETWIFKNKPFMQDKILKEMEDPLKFIPIILGFYFCFEYLGFKMNTSESIFTNKFINSLIVFNAFWAIYNIVHPLSFLITRVNHGINRTIVDWGVRVSRFIIVIIGTASILEKWNVPVTSLIASLGIFGMAVALGAQDIFKNIIAGVAVITEKRFNVGDAVKVEGSDGDIEGIVENIGFRSTLIRKYDKSPMYVPNTTLSDGSIINYSSRKHRRIKWNIGLEYRTSAAQLRYIRDEIETYLKDSKEFVSPPEATLQVRIDDFGDSSINVFICAFTNTNIWSEWMKIKEDLALRVKEIIEDEAHAGFAFPSTSIYIEKQDKSIKESKFKPKKK